MNSIVNKGFKLQKQISVTAKKKTIMSKTVWTPRQKSNARVFSNRKKSVKAHRFKNKKPLWRRKSQLWVKLFRAFVVSLNGFNRRFKLQDKNSWTDLLKYRRIRWYFKNKIATRKSVHIYFGTKNKKAFLRLQDKIRLHTRSLLKCLQILDNRLDVFIVRIGWGRTIRIARNMILFGVLVVNDTIIKKIHHSVLEGDSVAINSYTFKLFTMFKCLRKKSIVRYKMYRDLIKKKKLRLKGRWKKKKNYSAQTKQKAYKISRSLRFRRTKFPWFKKKRYAKYALKKFRGVNTKRFLLAKNHIFFTDLFFFEKSKKFCYVIWLYNLHAFFSVFQYYRKPWFENIKFFNVLSSTKYI